MMLNRKDVILIGIAVVVLLGGCVYESWQDRRAKGGGRTWLAIALALAVLAAGIFAAHRAHARDLDGRHAAANPELHDWFDSLRSGKGPCCSDADGSAVSDVDWESRDGHYRVRIEEHWWDVPDDAVITEPNRVGRTMVWPIYYRSIGAPVRVEIRCFMPGSMT
jgi:hypothetical protein